MTTLTDMDLAELDRLRARCGERSHDCLALKLWQVDALLAMARRLREIERTWGLDGQTESVPATSPAAE